jgi:DNA repair and recombination RAD54-like protein
MLGMNRLQVLIVSYETFRMHSSKFERPGSCDLLICDEAHRLKNDQTLTNKVHQFICHSIHTIHLCFGFLFSFVSAESTKIHYVQALAALPCKRRILLSGTPMQVLYSPPILETFEN